MLVNLSYDRAFILRAWVAGVCAMLTDFSIDEEFDYDPHPQDYSSKQEDGNAKID